MRNLLTIDDTLGNKISYYHLAFFLITLPFDRLFSELALISFLIHTIIHLTRNKTKMALRKETIVVSAVFFITLLGLTYSDDRSQGMKDLQRQLAILLWPILLAVSGIDLGKYKLRLLQVFGWTCVLTIIYLYADALRIILYNKLPLTDLFTQSFINHNFSSPIDIHATYLAMYCLLSVIVFIYLFVSRSIRTGSFFLMMPLFVLLAGLLQLASRSVLISAIMIAVIFPVMMIKGARRSQLVKGITLTGVVIAILIVSISSFRMRYVGQFKDDLVQSSMNNEILEPRVARWRLVLDLVKQSPVYGHGSGSEKRLLNESYFKNKLYNSFLHELNSHNQYLSLSLKSGLIGLTIFLISLFIACRIALMNRDPFLGGLLVMIVVVSFSENILDVNKGIFFYSFFLSLFILSGKPFERLYRLNTMREGHIQSRPQNKRENAAVVSSDNHL
ncbi:MAG: O-antigen ligase family protein [Chitinophagaceae bacterium]|nr:O-antigen ligase family protein [Chitinophagaceae bacterium]